MVHSNPRLEQILARLRERDFRLTPQRLAVLRILVESKDHPTVDQIYEQVRRDFPMVSRATIYKTANLLKSLGEALEVGVRDGRSHYDGNKPYPHPHVICTRCKKIIDFEDLPTADLVQEVIEKTGFQIETHQMDFFGTCPQCREAEKN